MEYTIDYEIANWNLVPIKYLDFFQKKANYNIDSIRDLNYNCLRLYSLFKCVGIDKPNGIYTTFKEGLPLDNLIWWDFVVENDKGFVHLVRTCKQLEVTFYHEDSNFNIHTFFQKNLEKYKDEINFQILKFEKHIVYINHYKSYLNSITDLIEEVRNINLDEPPLIKGHIATKQEIDVYLSGLKVYTSNLIAFHPKAKSLLLNTAFMIESFINIIIRIGAKKELLNYEDVLKKYLNYSFKEKLENIKFFTHIFKHDIDIDRQEIKNILDLISIRNKYVHFDENSKINILGEEYFDDIFPLFNLTKKSFQIEVLNKAYLNPSKENVEKYYKSAFDFIEYIFSLIDDRYIENIKILIEINPLSYNTKKKVYSSIFPDAGIEFYLDLKK
ncbi:hypothetical protein [Flavobacterium sp. UBA4854]|uniref:hypothetical protein n=1 Tax=Flavobacterium sp. UBA4854 TaxID=1946548 RepID=UPI00257A03A2|nr:hypothetical protein [Flavobacterium sp. UBA4854]